MVMTDPIADLIIRIKNAITVKKKKVRVQYSKLKYEILKIFKEKGVIEDFERIDEGKKSYININLKYPAKYRNFKRISKPGRRIYIKYKNIVPVKQGYGFGIISTPKGILTETEAKKQKLGGEYMLEVF
jgi:small subunit ribosomal protein S8